MQVQKRPLHFKQGLTYRFPKHMCCNCGCAQGLLMLDQDTRRTTYLFGGGSELTFQLRLPFCDACAPSARRRPRSAVHWMLVFLLAFAMSAASLIVLGDQVLENPLLLKYGLLPLSLLMTAGVTAFVHWRARPRTGQASYYQPVRVVEVRREFFSGMVTSIRFSFANRDYQAAFEAANQREIASLLLTVKSR